MLGNLGCRLRKSIYVALLIGVAWLFFPPGAFAQRDGGRIVISSSETGSPPIIILRAYAIDEQGKPLELGPNNVVVSHNGEVVSDVQVIGDYQAGTFTVFVVDVPGGLEGQLQSIQETIEQFSSPPYMEERADYIALYRVGATDADQLLTPANFYNTIRNFFFSTPLEPATEQTALADSMGNLLNEIPSLNPKGDMATSIVLITDGTDAVSESFQLEDLGALASSLGIPIHTIWVQNEGLLAITQDEGRGYLAQLASETGGVSAQLGQPDTIADIWNRITALRNHQVIQYRPENIRGGQNEVTLSLQGKPGVEDSTQISIPESAPSIEIILPLESREISLDTLEDPVRLSFTTSVNWLDGVERTVSSAELLVNRIPVQQIEVDELDRFTAEINYFSYGPNDIQVRIEDELGQIASSPIVTLSVLEGETELPEEMRPGGISDSPLFRTGLLCLAVFLVLAIIAVIVTVLRRIGIRGRLRRSSDRRNDSPDGDEREHPTAPIVEMQASDFPADSRSSEQLPASEEQIAASKSPYLEVVTSVTRMPPIIELTAVEHRIGRSPIQADIVLENDITVSRLHASIVLEGSDYRIYDEGSSSGTWVNGQQVPDYGHQLLDGDEIRLGDSWMRYRR
ncbi:MAG: FHA domain-containing protein [Candidatus Promineifilaceae bacterium]